MTDPMILVVSLNHPRNVLITLWSLWQIQMILVVSLKLFTKCFDNSVELMTDPMILVVSLTA